MICAVPSPSERRGPSDGAVMLALFGLALVIRLPGSGSDLWLDEIATLLHFVRPPLSEIITSYETPNNHVLYSVLAHLSISVFGESARALRLPALLFGAASAPALYYLAIAWLPRRESAAAALILAVSYHLAYFSQNARGYTGLLLLTLLSAAWLARAIETGRRGYWFGFAAATAANIYMLLSGLFATAGLVLGALAVYVLPAAAAERRRRLGALALWVAVAAALTLLLYAPLLAPMLEAFTQGDTDVGWGPLELIAIVMRDATTITHLPLLVLAALAVAPVLAAGTISILRRAPYVFFVLALPPILEMGAALALGAGTYPRRFLLLLPFFALVAVRGVALAASWATSRLGRPAWRTPAFAAAIALGVAAAAMGLQRLYTLPMQDYSGALAFIQENREADDIVAAAYITSTSAAYYAPDALSARTAEDLQAILDAGRPVWLLVTFMPDMRQREPVLTNLVETMFEPAATFRGLVGDGEVVVWRTPR